MHQLLVERRVRPLGVRIAVAVELAVASLGEGHLPEQSVVLAEVEAVVGGEDDRRVVHEAHVLDLAEQVADPVVDHGDLAAVGRVGLLDPGCRHLRVVAPVRVYRLHNFAVVVRHVQLGVVRGSVPRLVRVPGVYVQEELLLVVPLQPVPGADHRLGDVPVRLLAPPRHRVLRLVVADPLDPGGRALLSLDGEEGLEAAIVVEAVAPVEGRIDDGRGVDALIGEKLGQRANAVGEGLPPHERQRPASGEVVGPRRHGRKRRRVVAVESYRAGRQIVERGRVYEIDPVRAQVVPPEGVRNDPDNVHCLVLTYHILVCCATLCRRTEERGFGVTRPNSIPCERGVKREEVLPVSGVLAPSQSPLQGGEAVVPSPRLGSAIHRQNRHN